MTEENSQKLSEIVRSVLQLPTSADVASLRQISVETWDSLAHVSLMLAIESEFGISIDISDQVALTSVPAIRIYLEERGL